MIADVPHALAHEVANEFTGAPDGFTVCNFAGATLLRNPERGGYELRVRVAAPPPARRRYASGHIDAPVPTTDDEWRYRIRIAIAEALIELRGES